MNATEEDGWTPLHRAAYEGHQEVAKYLIKQGAAVEAKANSGWTPLHWAAQEGHREVVEYLIEQGAAVEKKRMMVVRTCTWQLSMAEKR